MEKIKTFLWNSVIFCLTTIGEFFCTLKFLYAKGAGMEILWFLAAMGVLMIALLLVKGE